MLYSNKKIILTLSFLLITSLLYSGKIKKGFEALDEYNYFKAKALFEKSLKKKVVPASYGLSIIYFRTDNPFHNLDSASKFIRYAKVSYAQLEPKTKEKLVVLRVDSLTIEFQKDRIDSALYARTDQLANFEAYDNYIKQYPTSKLISVAIASRDKVYFEQVKQENTAIAYQRFFENYPNAVQVKKAKKKYEELLYIEQTSIGNVESYQRFIRKYPNSPFKTDAQDSVYHIQTKTKTIKSYDGFIKENPENRNINKAWRNLYKLYTADYSPERIVEFRIDYPDYPFKEEVETDMKLATKTFLPFKDKNRWGFMDENGVVMISAQYDFVEPFQEGLALVIKNGLLGFIDKSGKAIIPFSYDDGESFTNGLSIVSKNDSYGIINRLNKVIVPLKYEVLTQFSDGLALVADDKGYGYINEKGVEVIPVNLSYAKEFKRGFALVEVDGKKGIINPKAEFVVQAKYSWLELFNESGIARAKNDTSYGLLNSSGEEITPFIYDRIGEFNSGLAITKLGEKYGYLNTKGEMKIEESYDYQEGVFLWGNFENDYAKYSRKGKFGILDTAGKELTPSIFENIINYKPNNYTQVKKRGKWGYMSAKLQLKVPYEYEKSFPFIGEYAVVFQDTAWGAIDKDANWVVEPLFSEASLVSDSLFIVKSQTKYGLTSNNLEEIIPVNYNRIVVESENQLIRLFVEEKMYYFNLETRKYIKPTL